MSRWNVRANRWTGGGDVAKEGGSKGGPKGLSVAREYLCGNPEGTDLKLEMSHVALANAARHTRE